MPELSIDAQKPRSELSTMRRLGIKWVFLSLFLSLTVPVLVSIIVMNYVVSDRVVRSDSLERIAQHQGNIIASVDNLFREVTAHVVNMASVGHIQPDLFADASSIDFLASVTRGTPDVLSAYVGLERDGTFFQGRRMLPGQLVHEQDLPIGTVYARRTVATTELGLREDSYKFLDEDFLPLGSSTEQNPYDPRQRPWYQMTKAAGAVTISDPDLFATLSLVGFTISAPIYEQDEFVGVVAIDLTLDGMSQYLARRKVSPGSISFILDDQGNIIANSLELAVFETSGGRLRLPHISEWSEPLAGVAYSQRSIGQPGKQTFFFNYEGQEYAASLQPINAAESKEWKILIIAPMSDFNSAIKANIQKMLIIGLCVTALQILIVWYLAHRMATPLERLVANVERIRDLSDEPMVQLPRTPIREITKLSNAVETLDSVIRSFASFVPVGLVRQLLQADQRLEIGGSSRFLTVFFSDIEGFSALSEKIPANELVRRISDYLTIVTAAVNRESGTIDKFIGDGVMAFWGAPAMIEDHAQRACIAALRVRRDIETLNTSITARGGAPMNVRIGIHSDAVVVGNVGSAERLSYTVLGDGVNIAARLEALNKAYGTCICISQTVYREAGDTLCVRPIGDVQLKGRRSRIVIYELMGAFGQEIELEPSQAVMRLAELSRQGFEKQVSGDIEGARALYEKILEENPDDRVARVNLAELNSALSQ